MSSLSLLIFVVVYFLFLFLLSRFLKPDKQNENLAFFNSQRSAKWIFVSIGMIGTTMSGITFVSVPGIVGENQHSYFQFILGNAVGFLFIAFLLLPVFYSHKVISIYEYLQHRFGMITQRYASGYFILSRVLGASLRFFLAMIILQKFIFDSLGLHFFFTSFIGILMIWLYTNRGGLKTIIVTDLFQTTFMMLSVIISIYFINQAFDKKLFQTINHLVREGKTQIFFFDSFLTNSNHFIKQFTGGVFITVCMVGLDQDIMQKNLSVKNYNQSKKNMIVFTIMFTLINLMFLYLGSMLFMYKDIFNIDFGSNTDYLFPTILLNYLTPFAAVVFMLGLTSSSFSSTDSALTALTTSFCVDILQFRNNKRLVSKYRQWVHIFFAILVWLTSIILYTIESKQIVSLLFTVASYTYGPILGLFALGLLTKRRYSGRYILPLTFLPPCILYIIMSLLKHYNIYHVGYELILFNGSLTFLCLLLFSHSDNEKDKAV